MAFGGAVVFPDQFCIKTLLNATAISIPRDQGGVSVLKWGTGADQRIHYIFKPI